MALMPRHLYGEWTLTDEPRTRIVASNRRRRQRKVAAPMLPVNVTYERPADTRKPSLFRRAVNAVRRVIGG